MRRAYIYNRVYETGGDSLAKAWSQNDCISECWSRLEYISYAFKENTFFSHSWTGLDTKSSIMLPWAHVSWNYY